MGLDGRFDAAHMFPTMRAVTLLLAVAGLAHGRATRAGEELTVTYIGNMAIHVTDGHAALLSDFPYDAQGRFMPWTAEHLPDKAPRPLCLITHSHRDHFARELAPRFCGQLLGPKDAVHGAGVEPLAMSPAVRWNDATIRPLATPHANLEHYSYLVEWHGLRLFFTGDTEDPAALLAAGRLDVAFVSPWLLRTLQQRNVTLDARRIISYHHDDGDSVPLFQQRVIPRRGEALRIASE